MNDTQEEIAPALLQDVHPSGLNPDAAVNGGLVLKAKPRGIKRINKKGILLVGGLIGVAAVVATSTFNQAGRGISSSTKEAVANQGKNNKQTTDIKHEALWYAHIPDKVASANTQTKGNASTSADASKTSHQETGQTSGQQVPDLDGQSVNLLEAAVAPPTNAQPGASNPQAQIAAQAMSAGLAAPGFNTEKTTVQAPPTPSAMAPTSYAGAPGQQKMEEDQNKQNRKDQFLMDAKLTDPDYSPSSKTAPLSPYELKAGSVIPAVMISGINSDLPGQVIAQVRENVYDTKTGRYLLIPQGSRLVGLYDAHVAYGQQRILLAWSRIIYPNGDSFNLKGMPGADQSGYAGFFDQVDNHYFKIFGSALLMSMISAGVQLSQPDNGNNMNNQSPSVSQTVGAALGQQIGQTAMAITQKNLNIQPTLEIRPGYRFNVMVTADMILPSID